MRGRRKEDGGEPRLRRARDRWLALVARLAPPQDAHQLREELARLHAARAARDVGGRGIP